jgi:hypothetical protein
MTKTPTLDSIQAELDRLKKSNVKDENEPEFPYVIIRTYSAGVHVGYMKRLDENTQTVELVNARRIFRWRDCALTLSEISLNGISAESTLSDEIDRIILLEAIEVIFSTVTAKNILRNHKNG